MLYALVEQHLPSFQRKLAERERCVPAPSDAQMVDLLATIIVRILRRLLRDGWLTEDAEQPRLELATEDIIDEFAAASIR